MAPLNKVDCQKAGSVSREVNTLNDYQETVLKVAAQLSELDGQCREDHKLRTPGGVDAQRRRMGRMRKTRRVRRKTCMKKRRETKTQKGKRMKTQAVRRGNRDRIETDEDEDEERQEGNWEGRKKQTMMKKMAKTQTTCKNSALQYWLGCSWSGELFLLLLLLF